MSYLFHRMGLATGKRTAKLRRIPLMSRAYRGKGDGDEAGTAPASTDQRKELRAMRVMKVEIEGTEGGATLRRAEGIVKAQWVTAAQGAREAEADARDHRQLENLARELQSVLDGYRGTGTDIGAYRRLIEMLTD
jgi:hypothetical protein